MGRDIGWSNFGHGQLWVIQLTTVHHLRAVAGAICGLISTTPWSTGVERLQHRETFPSGDRRANDLCRTSQRLSVILIRCSGEDPRPALPRQAQIRPTDHDQTARTCKRRQPQERPVGRRPEHDHRVAACRRVHGVGPHHQHSGAGTRCRHRQPARAAQLQKHQSNSRGQYVAADDVARPRERNIREPERQHAGGPQRTQGASGPCVLPTSPHRPA